MTYSEAEKAMKQKSNAERAEKAADAAAEALKKLEQAKAGPTPGQFRPTRFPFPSPRLSCTAVKCTATAVTRRALSCTAFKRIAVANCCTPRRG